MAPVHPRCRRRLIMSMLAAALLSGCAGIPSKEDDFAAIPTAVHDPNESFNRKMLDLNLRFDAAVMAPAVRAYRSAVPQPVRTGVGNFLNNLRSPVIFANDMLQGQFRRAGETAARFTINSTLGGLGFGDPASDFGIRFHNEDFGQTLAVWGVPEGPYTMAPILGPSNPRDTVGTLLEFFFDPLNFWAFSTERFGIVAGRTVARGIERREKLDDLFIEGLKQSFDPYITIRSVHRQRRLLMIRNQEDLL